MFPVDRAANWEMFVIDRGNLEIFLIRRGQSG